MRNIVMMGMIVLFAFDSSAADRKFEVPAWALRSLHKVGELSRATLARPVAVAGVRGRRFRSDELYWKMTTPSVRELFDKAEEEFAGGNYPAAKQLYLRTVLAGASGRDADRSTLGLAVCDLAQGKASAARQRLSRLVTRTSDLEVRITASIQLAIATAVDGNRAEARLILESLAASHHGHPLASQASAILWIWEQ